MKKEKIKVNKKLESVKIEGTNVSNIIKDYDCVEKECFLM